MKLPAHCERVRENQVWEKRTDLPGHNAWTSNLPPPQVVITGRAKSRKGSEAWHTIRYDQYVRTGHAIAEHDLWRFYKLIGNRLTVRAMKNEHLRKPSPHL